MKASVQIAIQNSSSQAATSFRETFFPWFHWSLIILESETLFLVSTEIYNFSGAVHSVNSCAHQVLQIHLVQKVANIPHGHGQDSTNLISNEHLNLSKCISLCSWKLLLRETPSTYKLLVWGTLNRNLISVSKIQFWERMHSSFLFHGPNARILA